MEVGVPRGRQLEALLAALVLQDAGQQLVGRAHVVAKGCARVLCGVPQRLGQPQGPVPIHLRLITAQLLILEQGRKHDVCKPTVVAWGPSCLEIHPFLVEISSSGKN